MNKFLENLANLIKVKTIVTLAVIAVFVTLSLTGVFPVESVKDVTLLVISFYFGTQAEKKLGGNS